MVVALVALMTSKRKNDDNEDGRARKSFMDRHDTSAQSGGRHSIGISHPSNASTFRSFGRCLHLAVHGFRLLEYRRRQRADNLAGAIADIAKPVGLAAVEKIAVTGA